MFKFRTNISTSTCKGLSPESVCGAVLINTPWLLPPFAGVVGVPGVPKAQPASLPGMSILILSFAPRVNSIDT